MVVSKGQKYNQLDSALWQKKNERKDRVLALGRQVKGDSENQNKRPLR